MAEGVQRRKRDRKNLTVFTLYCILNNYREKLGHYVILFSKIYWKSQRGQNVLEWSQAALAYKS